MAGISIGGLISGLDTNNIISQLVALERQPITRLQNRVTRLGREQQAIRDLRTLLTTVRSRAQDFRLSDILQQFQAPSTDDAIVSATVSGDTPAQGAYAINVTQLASATQARSSAPLGAAVNPGVNLNASGIGTAVTAGTFSINGVQFTVDPATDTLNGVLSDINGSGAGVIASYNPATDKITIENATPNDTSLINFGATGDTSNLLAAINVGTAVQTTGATGSTEVQSTRNLGAINPGGALSTTNFAGGAVTAGSFAINGVSINVNPAVDSLTDILSRINSSDAQVTANYDATTDTIRVVSRALGSRTINFTSGSSNFLDVTNLTTATQTAGNDAQFTINGGPVQTRNTNEVTDAVDGVVLNLRSLGTATVTVGFDDDAVIEDVQSFLDAFNESLTGIRALVGEGGVLENDGSIRLIESELRNMILNSVGGLSGQYSNLLQVGISTGASFDSSQVSLFELDADAFRTALAQDREGVSELFANNSDTGIGNLLEDYLESAVSTQGFLNARSRSGGTIDLSIDSVNSRIELLERRVTAYQARLRAQFTRMEQMVASFQQAGNSLSALGANLGR